MNLRHNKRPSFSGFTPGEVEKMESLLKEDGEQFFGIEYCKKLARAFNASKGRTGKAVVKWTEVQNWFQTQPPIVVSEKGADGAESETDQLFRAVREACSLIGNRGKKVPELPKMMEFEAKSSKDGAWYDVDKFVGNKRLDSSHAVVLVRFTGFDKDQDEWVKVMDAVRQRSISLKASECHKVEVGETALYYLEKGKDEAKYFEAEISDIQRKMHGMRSCKCEFTIRYIYDNNKKKIPLQEKVELKTLYFRPNKQFS